MSLIYRQPNVITALLYFLSLFPWISIILCVLTLLLYHLHMFFTWHIAFFAGIYVLPPTTCMHIFLSSLYCWKWWTSRSFAGLEHFGWFDLLHVRPYIMHPFEINWPRDMKWWNPVLILLFDLFLQGLCMYAGMQ